MNKSTVAIFILTGIFFIAFIVALHPWFFWGYEDWLVCFCLLGIFFVFSFCPEAFDRRYNRIAFFLLFLCYLNQYKTSNINGLVFAHISVLFVGGILALRNEYKIILLDNLSKLFSLFLLPSLCLWILYLFGFKFLPASYAEFVQFNGQSYTYTNYYFFMIDNRFVNSVLPRFSSVFLEPGHLGMTTALLLAANDFDLKDKYNRIILAVSLSTFSLAAYVILFLGKLFQLFINKYKHRLLVLFVFVVLFIGSWLFAAMYNNGDNIVNSYIFSRFELTGDEDIIAGNNRFSADFEQYYADVFMTSSSKWLGIGNEYGKMVWEGGNAGYKVYIVQNGLLGVLFVVLFYFSLLCNQFSRGGLLLICLFLISYLQRSYPLWLCFLLPVICGVQRKYINQKNENEYRKTS